MTIDELVQLCREHGINRLAIDTLNKNIDFGKNYDCQKEAVERDLAKLKRYTKRFNEIEKTLTELLLQNKVVCVNCDEETETHTVCADCLTKIIKENK